MWNIFILFGKIGNSKIEYFQLGPSLPLPFFMSFLGGGASRIPENTLACFLGWGKEVRVGRRDRYLPGLSLDSAVPRGVDSSCARKGGAKANSEVVLFLN